MPECKHAIRVTGCIHCKDSAYEQITPLRLDLIGPCRHALKEPGCQNCKGLESDIIAVTPRISVRIEIIRAASEEVKEAIKAWRKQWRAASSVICHWCRQIFSPDDCHADHVIPLSRSGRHDLSNLVIACAKCNFRKNARMPEVWAEMIAHER